MIKTILVIFFCITTIFTFEIEVNRKKKPHYLPNYPRVSEFLTLIGMVDLSEGYNEFYGEFHATLYIGTPL